MLGSGVAAAKGSKVPEAGTGGDGRGRGLSVQQPRFRNLPDSGESLRRLHLSTGLAGPVQNRRRCSLSSLVAELKLTLDFSAIAFWGAGPKEPSAASDVAPMIAVLAVS